MEMKLIKSDIRMTRENQQRALKALQHAVRTRPWIVNAEGDQEPVELTCVSVEDILAAPSLAEVFGLFGWRLITSQGAVSGIELCEEPGKYTHDDEILFALIAPFVEIGNIEIDGIDNEGHLRWQWQFTGVRCLGVLEDDENWNVLLDERLNPETLPELELKITFLGTATLRSHDPMQAREGVKALIEMALKQLDPTIAMYITSLDVDEQ